MGCFAQSNLQPCPQDQNAFWNNCYGTFKFSNGDKYVGQFKDDKRHGQGTLTFSNGNKYVGEYKDNKRHGQGTYTFSDGNKYVGEFRDGDFNGQGTYTWTSGTKYVGQFKDDKRNGQGTLTFSNGNKYVGEFRDGDFNGQGIRYDAKGQIIESGFYENDKLVRPGQVDTSRPPTNQAIAVENNARADSASEKRQDCYKTYNEWRATQNQQDSGMTNGLMGALFGSECYLLQLHDVNCRRNGVDPSPFDGALKRCVATERREWTQKCINIGKATDRCAPASDFDACMGRLGHDSSHVSRCKAIFGN
jgi:hypothetical protein